MVRRIFLLYIEFMQAFWDIEEAQAKAIQHLASFVRDKNGKALFYNIFILRFPYILR